MTLPFTTERPSPETRGKFLVSLDMWSGTFRGVPPHLFLAYLGEELGNSIDSSSLGLTAQSLCKNLSVNPGLLAVNCKLKHSLLPTVCVHRQRAFLRDCGE